MYCDRCKSTVYADDVHSCYDADAIVVMRDRERAVIDAALAWVKTADTSDDCDRGDECICARDLERADKALRAAVRALHAEAQP